MWIYSGLVLEDSATQWVLGLWYSYLLTTYSSKHYSQTKKILFINHQQEKKKLEIIVVNWFESIFDVTKVCLKNQSKPWLREMAPRRRRELAIFTLQHSNFDYFHTALWIQAQKRVLYELEKNLQTGERDTYEVYN